MTLSQYVLDTISTIKHLGYDSRHRVTAILKDASLKAEKEDDAQILSVLSGVLSMAYSESEKNYSPMLTLSNGNRTFSMDDIQASDIETIEPVANEVSSIWIQAQLFDILWILSKNYQYGRYSVSAYLKWFEQAFNPNEWVECHQTICRALDISKQLGKTSQEYKQVRKMIDDAIHKMDGTDPLFLSINLIQLVYPDASNECVEKYLQVINKIVHQRITEGNENISLVEETFSVQRGLLKRLKRNAGIDESNLAQGDYYEKYADRLLERNDELRAIVLLKKACSIYAKVDRKKLLVVRAQIKALQQSTIGNMKSIPIEYDVNPLHEYISQLFSGLSLQETIVQLGRLVQFCEVEETARKVIEEQHEFIFKSMFSNAILNKHGQITEIIPPLDVENPRENPDLFHKHMVHFVSERRHLGESIALKFAYKFLRDAGPFSSTDLDFLVCDNPIIPDGREEIIKTGLYLGLSGELYSAMHILLPQMEHTIRNLVDLCGDTITFLKDDGTEEYKPLSQLFRSDKLHECYNDDIIFTFQSIMDERAGENLRNLNAHGLLDPNIGNSESAFYFLCLVIKFLSLYSPDTHPILERLSNQEFMNDHKSNV
ncbi:DUF4209 domain-containing protein [Pseudoflavonifractor sp. 60]|uniref:DUF4209 domain-containing protein n=1 Tax=Pseudoflavonifractor sp. 60 TaxID=2304576 RepID=UPI00136AF3A2|nr:DUF4209 domain-containing protein [Pseudoflavonifractor sp. 60]NBI67901.1 DUF4209 domain-containing protein [Pseudoflavonifractor sp. 60]